MNLKISPERSHARIARLYREGLSSPKIALKYGVTSPCIIAILRKRRVKIKSRGRYPNVTG